MGWVEGGLQIATNTVGYFLGKSLDVVSEGFKIVSNSVNFVTQVAKAAIGQGKQIELSKEQAKKAAKHGDRRVKGEMLEIAGDTGGILFLSIAQSITYSGMVYFVDYLTQPVDPDEEDPQAWMWLNAKTVLVLGTTFISWGIISALWVTSQKKQSEKEMRSMIFAAGAFKDYGKLGPLTQGDVICKLHNCSLKRDISHSLYEDANYVLFKAALALMGVGLPVVNNYLISPAGYSTTSSVLDFTAGPLKWLLGAMLTGRYLINQILNNGGKGLCSKHQLHYLKEYYEWGILAGLSVEGMTYLLALTVSTYTGINQHLVGGLLQSIILIGVGGVINRAQLPQPPAYNSTRVSLDPFYYTHQGIAILTRIAFPPLKGAIQAILEQEGEPLPILDYLKKCVAIAQSPGAELFIQAFLPNMVRGMNRGAFDYFVQDNIVKGRFPGLARKVINYITFVETFEIKILDLNLRIVKLELGVRATKVAQVLKKMKESSKYCEKVMSYLIKKYELPEPLIMQALEIAGSKKVLEQVLKFKAELIRLEKVSLLNDDPTPSILDPLLWLGFKASKQKPMQTPAFRRELSSNVRPFKRKASSDHELDDETDKVIELDDDSTDFFVRKDPHKSEPFLKRSDVSVHEQDDEEEEEEDEELSDDATNGSFTRRDDVFTMSFIRE